ncbi:hypothetical protein ACOBR2_06445 [Telmatobacter bradus]|uniref:hypothetical protein n=1 Tax=Telmatobacter bradus TaxID=474953 RepID=UPI003B434D9D
MTLCIVCSASFSTTGTATIEVSYGGTSWMAEGTSAMSVTAATITAANATTTYTVSIPSGVDISTLAIGFIVVPDGAGGNGSIYLNVYDIYIQ